MPAVEVKNVVKIYADKAAVNDLSFTVESGEIFGLIGPNGAGKTTTIRMMMDIIQPDSGSVAVLGEKLSQAIKKRIGYLPEERGLYRKLSVMDSIIYLASLKGMDRRRAEVRADELLAQTGMSSARNKKIEELSKGMGQIIQFIVTIVHDPELLILDEPFASLDPVNAELLINMVIELRSRGKAIILSTHQMNQVEELCNRILMINQGKAVLYGDLAQIKARYRSNSASVLLDAGVDTSGLPGVAASTSRKGYNELTLSPGTKPQDLLDMLVKRGVSINRFEIATPSLNDIFIQEAGKKHA
jgi:ABC-2 type transport system ATP-binding protein